MQHWSTSPVRMSRVNITVRCAQLAFSWQCPVVMQVTAGTWISMWCLCYFPFPLPLLFNLISLLHKTNQRILTKFTTVPRAFKRWNVVYWLNYRSYLSLLSSYINHLLSMTLKRKSQAIILINKVNALRAIDSWNMVFYLSCLLWTIRCVSLCWCEL